MAETNIQQIQSLLKDARQKLVETGTRNRLVHVNRGISRANVLNVVNERSDDVYDILKTRARKMRFKATGKDKPKNTENDDTPLLVEFPGEEEFDEARYTDNRLETPLGPDANQKRLLRLARDAKTSEEEQGINILYLAMGFLTWFEDKSSAVKREAPLILLPVELVRNAKTSSYDLVCRDDDVVTNLPLQERLSGDFGITLPEIETDEEDWSPSIYFDKIQELISSRSGWAIDRDGMQLGFFSFAKLLMLRDLDPDNWPNGELAGNTLVKGLLASGFEEETPLFGREDRLDEKLKPADIIQVVDADASQTKVIEEVRAGRNLVVQGPPGTGKSQTITNIIASAVHDGKTILFVAEKMAALSVVHNRLKKVGLENICLELHSKAANKKQVIAELARALNYAGSIVNVPDPPDELTQLRDKLNDVVDVLHSEVKRSGQSAFQIIAELVNLAGKGTPPPTINGEHLSTLSKPALEELEALIDTYCTLLKDENNAASHPLFGTRNLDLQPLDIQRLKADTSILVEPLEKFTQSADNLCKVLNISEPTLNDVSDVSEFFESVAAAPAHAEGLLGVFYEHAERASLVAALKAGIEWQNDLKSVSAMFVESALLVPIEHLRSPIAVASGSWFAKWGAPYRSASRELASLLNTKLPKSASDRLNLIDRLILVQKNKTRFEQSTELLSRKLGASWHGEQTQFDLILSVANWLEEIKSKYPEVNQSTLAALSGKSEPLVTRSNSLREQKQKFSDALRKVFETLDLDALEVFSSADLNKIPMFTLQSKLLLVHDHCQTRYGDWCQLAHVIQKLDKASLAQIRERIDRGELTSSSAIDELRYARADALWVQARNQYPALDKIAQLPRHEIVDQFRELEQRRTNDVRELVIARHNAQLPTGAIGEMGIIRGEIGKKRAHKPVRRLMQSAGEMVQRIKPVLLMSPVSVAQFLPPQSIRFDLLVIDEASQVKPEEALGVIARVNQIVVVGDKKQLPPTSFFDRLTGNSDDEDEESAVPVAAKVTEMESILTLCEARSISSRMLEWHYRSRDPSLIRVSNIEFYNSNLVLPPSPLENDDDYGMMFTRVNGAYSSRSKGLGKPGTNKIEAQAIAGRIAAHARKSPKFSLGVVAFSVTQRNMITEILEYDRRNDEVLDAFLREGRSEDVFVKNIENVQGDERDVILVSVGYGPNEPGTRLASMSFGPINSDGGERRLNVLFSRARIRCEIFASFDPGEIDLSRTQKAGPRVLKRFLEFAKTGVLDQTIPTGGDADSPFEEDVANEIRNLNYAVDHQVGSAGFLIDLGVKHPARKGQYMLAVECDGATYHSALWARERDRLRQDVLEHLGWKFHRIWSTDWFHRRPQELERLKQVLEATTKDLEDGVTVEGANSDDPRANTSDPVEAKASRIETLILPELSCPPYELASFTISTTSEPHEVSTAGLAEIVQRIVEIEGPIHEEEVARRLAASFGKEKAGRRIVEAAKTALLWTQNASAQEPLMRSGAFWFTSKQQENTPVRNRRDVSTSIQKADMLPPMEIKAAIRMVVSQSGTASEDDIIRATARLFGFERVGSGLKAVIQAELSPLRE